MRAIVPYDKNEDSARQLGEGQHWGPCTETTTEITLVINVRTCYSTGCKTAVKSVTVSDSQLPGYHGWSRIIFFKYISDKINETNNTSV